MNRGARRCRVVMKWTRSCADRRDEPQCVHDPCTHGATGGKSHETSDERTRDRHGFVLVSQRVIERQKLGASAYKIARKRLWRAWGEGDMLSWKSQCVSPCGA